MPTLKCPYVLERPVYNCELAMSIKTQWRQLPYFLHELKRMNVNIHKAKMHKDWTTMHMKLSASDVNTIYNDRHHMERVLSGISEIDDVPLHSLGLPQTTCVHIYNTMTFPYTLLDFGCTDRTGLFCEILEFLTPYDIELQGAYINTIGNVANNMFYITRNNQKLDNTYIDFLHNSFEYELKKTVIDHNY